MFTFYYLTENIEVVVYMGCVLSTYTHTSTFFYCIFPLYMVMSWRDTHTNHSTECWRVWLHWAHLQNCEKMTVSFVISVRPHGATWLSRDEFSWHLISQYFLKICQENSSIIKLRRITGDWHEYLCTRMVISHCVLLRIKHFAGKSCRGNQNIFFVQWFFFSGSQAIY